MLHPLFLTAFWEWETAKKRVCGPEGVYGYERMCCLLPIRGFKVYNKLSVLGLCQESTYRCEFLFFAIKYLWY